MKAGSESVLVEAGDSSQAVFSPRGDRLLFVSKGRPGHAHAQIYEKYLDSGDERRITFQNGDTAYPQYHPKDDWIMYSSATDELKENPPLLHGEGPDAKLPAQFREPYEIYLHSLKALEIKRVSKNVGFDGEGRFTHDGKNLVWTRAGRDRVVIVRTLNGGFSTRNVRDLGPNPAQYTPSPDGKWQTWVDWDETFSTSKLKIQKAKTAAVEVAPELSGPKTDLFISPDSKWVLWSQWNTETSNYQLWSAELENGCVRRLSSNADHDRRHPVLSPDMSKFVFTLTSRGRSRIVLTAFTPPTGPCLTPP